MTEVKRITIQEFREFGYVQELNRQFLHPLGLALEVIVEDDGTERLGGIWDYREDPEGMIFGEGVMEPEKQQRVAAEWDLRSKERTRQLGYVVQPLD